MLRRLALPLYERLLRAEIRDRETPEHVAVIQDGNRRFARRRGEDPSEGHVYGAETTEAFIDWASEFGISEITLYAFSTENFERPDDELERLFDLIADKLDSLAEDERIHSNGIRVRGIGDVERLPERVQSSVDRIESVTSGYDDYLVNIAIGYGGRAELLDATRSIMESVEDGDVDADDIDAETVSEHVYTEGADDVDLVIRTGGNERISNFLPWQAKGNESTVYFCAPYWPAFRKIDFLRAIRTYGHRRRRRHDRDVRRAFALVRELGRDELGGVREVLTGESRVGKSVADDNAAE